MQILANGRTLRTRRLLVEPMDVDRFADRLCESLGQHANDIRSTAEVGTTFRGERERGPAVDYADPRSAGWTFLINASDPSRAALIDALAPLAAFRRMRNTNAPLLFNGEAPDEWPEWLAANYSTLDGERPPHYVLIVGEPRQVPFHFQALLDAIACVGRVSFDTVDALRSYIEKLIRLETAPRPVTTDHAVIFATDEGGDDLTALSRRLMAEPLAQHIRDKCHCTATFIAGADATKARLVETLAAKRPALVYTATHGIAATEEPLDTQKQLNGALCCHATGAGASFDDLWTAADIPDDAPFLEGGAFFQFACHGYGTPAQSDYMHWFGDPALNATEDFIAALPKKMLAHPRGPIVYIGHVDVAWLRGFTDDEAPPANGRPHPRIEPFVFALNELLRLQPAGLAMANMNARYNIENARLASTFDRLQRRQVAWTPEVRRRLSDAFIFRSDAQNYMIFGDPAARLRIATT